jgi:hypothetical protein
MIVSVIARLVSAAVAYVIYVSKKAVPEADGTETGLQKWFITSTISTNYMTQYL